MKRILLICVMTLAVFASAIAGINEKMSASTQLFIAERDGKISLNIKLDGPKLMTRAPLLRTEPVDRLIAAPEDHNGLKVVPAFIRINPNRTSKIESMGVIVQERFNEFITALIPIDIIERVAEVSEVQEVSVARKLKLKTNMARYYTNADDVINYSNDAVTAGLPQAFKGSGVVVGVIDDGIDFQHMMFRDASGNYRIKRAYVARGQSSFNTYENITSSSPTTDDSSESHGTHTSSTAGGREITVNGTVYGGMAPEADLVLVGCGSYLYDTNIANGIKYVFDYADSQNKPAVCSLSLGSHMGPHDGTGYMAATYAQYAGNNPNHIIVYAAGNEAGGTYGTIYSGSSTSTSASPFTTVLNGLLYNNYYGYGSSYVNRAYYGYDVFYAREANRQLACKLHVVNTSNKSIVWTSSAITSSTSNVSGITTYFDSSPTVTLSRDNYSGKYYVQLYFNQMEKKSGYTDSRYALAVSVYPTNGSCGIDAWDVNGYNGFGSMSGSVGGYTFVAGSEDASVGDEGCSDDVISVGAYVSKTNVTDYRGSSHSLTAYYTLNDIAYFSSYQASGCGATGVQKPDICAPGATVVAGINHYDTNGMMANALSYAGYYLVYNSTNSSLGSMDGTSMATPCAAGIIALYLQAAKYVGKTLNTEGIRDVFANTAIHDNYTNKKNFGRYGKIDALAGVRYILGGAAVNPTLIVNPESLSFNGTVGQTYTKTFTLTGTRLTSGVNLSVSGNGIFSISPTSLTAAQAQAGATITVTYAPTASGTQTATVTATSTGATNATVALTGTAVNAPVLTATPDALNFTTTVGTSVNKTFLVRGTDLTGNVTLSVSGAGFSIDKTSITRNAATSGSTVTVTYNPTTAGTHTGTVTINSAGAETKTVTLNGTATETVRTITVNPTSLTFNSTTGVAVTQTFNVKGANLNGNLTLTLNNANGIYSIDRTSITAAQAQAANGVNVTVTYNPTVAGNSNATVTISGGGAESKTVSLSGTAVAPTITVNPTSLTFNTTTGVAVTQTFNVKGANLNGNLTLTLNNANGIYSIDRTSITAVQAQAANGVNVTVTYNPTVAGNSNATVTISGGGAESKTVNLNGTAVEPPRTITASTDVVNMSTIVGEAATATFTVTGENLTGPLTLALNDANGVYSIQPTTISAAQATQGVTVTVTYNPAEFGNHNASIVISGGGANPVTVNLNGTANIVKFAPVMLQANDAYVALTRFRAEWTDETPTYNVQSYTLEVNAKPSDPVQPDYVEVGNADFGSLTAVTNETGAYTNQINNAANFLPAGWTATSYLYIDDAAVVSRAYNNNYGTIVSPYYDFTGYDKVTVVLDVLRFNADNFTDAIVRISSSMGSQEISFSNISEYTTFTVVLDVAQTDRITLTTLQSCFALHNITIYAGDVTAAQNNLMASEAGGADYRLITGIAPDVLYYTVKDLTAGGTFLYRVKALYIDGTESDWSNIEEVTLFENEHPYTIGDVNHDDVVDVEDVSLLIGSVLGKEGFNACPICADVNGDEMIDIDDVATLINIVLGKNQSNSLNKAKSLGVFKYFAPSDK